MKTKKFTLQTKQLGFYDITHSIQNLITENNIKSGICIVYSPHTTSGITINENADPDVVTDLIFGLTKTFPDRKEYRHLEGNSHAHMKSSVISVSQTLIIENGQLLLGTWQSVYFCEFDGPRTRNYYVKIMEDKP